MLCTVGLVAINCGQGPAHIAAWPHFPCLICHNESDQGFIATSFSHPTYDTQGKKMITFLGPIL